jgi:small subunit ribosomal protein S20
MRAADGAALPRSSGMRPPPARPSTPKRGFRVANIKSQIKRNKQNEQARQRNKAVKSSLKTSVRRFREAADAGDTDAAVLAMRDASRSLDKAASKGVIHKKQAANRKSAMAKRAAELQS